jgi:phosphohistidine phosphatase
MRHAKAEGFAGSDHERVLTERGRREASATGSWLVRNDFGIDYALVSSSARTQETWKLVSDAAGWEVQPDVDSGLYSAGPDTALDLIRSLDDAKSVIVIGHNPTMAYLAQVLDDGKGDDEANAEMAAGGFPAAAVAVFSYDGEWADLEEGTCSLIAYHGH